MILTLNTHSGRFETQARIANELKQKAEQAERRRVALADELIAEEEEERLLLLSFHTWHAAWCLCARIHGWERRRCRLLLLWRWWFSARRRTPPR